MKSNLLLILFLSLLIEIKSQIGINATNTPPNSSAMLDVSSTTKGFLPPRMTSAERAAIATPADGLIVFDTDTKTLWNRQNGVWVNFLASGNGIGPWNLSGNSIFLNNNNRVGINSSNPASDLEIQGGGGLLITQPYTVTTTPPTNTYIMPYSGTIDDIRDNAGYILDPGGNANYLANTNYSSYVKLNPDFISYGGFRFTFESLDLSNSSKIVLSTSSDINNYSAYVQSISLNYNYLIGRPFLINSGPIYVHFLISSGNPSGTGFKLLYEKVASTFMPSNLYSEAIGNGLSYSPKVASFSVGNACRASGFGSIAMGFYSSATGVTSIAIGNQVKAIGSSSTTLGVDNIASGNRSTALGSSSNTNYKNSSFAIGGVGVFTSSRAINDKDYQMKMHFDEYQFLTGTSKNLIITDGQITTNNSLTVSGYTNTTLNGFGFLNNFAPAGLFPNTTTVPFSIYANSRIMAQEFNAFSDARHKKLQSFSDGKTDLEKLNQLKVSNYTFIDNVTKSSKIQLGFIAQQVEQIVPEAVNKITDFIPNVYDMAKSIHYDANANTLTVSTNKTHYFQAKDEIKLISLDKEYKVKVDKIIDANNFIVNNWEKQVDKIFVFGKRVDDFRTVDYDRLFTLGISSIQELSSRIVQLEKEMAELKKSLDLAGIKSNTNSITAIK